MDRVVVTGIGAVSPIGNSFDESWKASKKELSGIVAKTRFDVSDISWKVAGELKGFDAGGYLYQKEINRLDPFVHYAVAAAMMAAEDAKLIRKSEISNPPFPPIAKGGKGGVETEGEVGIANSKLLNLSWGSPMAVMRRSASAGTNSWKIVGATRTASSNARSSCARRGFRARSRACTRTSCRRCDRARWRR